jgi:PAS domain S-box-containing protein
MFEQYRDAIENSNIVSKTDIYGIITFVNDEFCKISGYSRRELIGQDHNIVRHPDVPADTFMRLWQTILTKETYRATVKNLTKEGNTFYVNTTITPILDTNGEIAEFIAIRYDVTREVELKLALEEKEKELTRLNQTLEERVKEQTKALSILNAHLEHRVQEEVEKNEQKQKILFSQSRFASLGQMIANIAHQWRQPLTELNLSLFGLKNASVPEEQDTYYRDAKKTIQSMSQTIEDFQNFFNPNKPIEPFDPVESFHDALTLIKKDLKKAKITLHTSLGKGIEITGISNELTQVLINLLQNAKESLAECFDKEKEIYVSILDAKTEVILSVQDNGTGIEEDKLEKIFDPYFSTKHASQGTGLGLFMSRMIVQQSLGGSIHASNNEIGALLTITIPKKDTTHAL